MSDHERDWLFRGVRLNDSRAIELEAHIAASPGDLDARLTLLAFALKASPLDSRWDDVLRDQWLWCIEHQPHGAFHQLLGGMLHQIPLLHSSVQERWQSALQRSPDDVAVLKNAAVTFFSTEKLDVAISLFDRMERRDPANPELPAFVGRALGKADASPAAQQAALAAFQRAFALDGTRPRRASWLDDAADLALRTQQHDLAREYALELLDAARALDLGWMHGNALYSGHRVLGHVALARGDIEGAERALLESGRTPGSPQLNSFGPELDLADALLALGRTEVVIEFLQLCELFWKPRQLRKWIEQIRAGERPQLNRFHGMRDNF